MQTAPLPYKRFALISSVTLLLTAACGLQGPPPTATPTSGPGLQRFEGDGFDLRLPESFVREGEDLYLELGENVTSSEDDYTHASVSRTKDSEFTDMALDDLVEISILTLGSTPGLTFLGREDLQSADGDLARLLTRADSAVTGLGQSVIIVQYILQDGDTMWVLSFGTLESALDSWLEVFDASAQSFHIYE